MALQLAFAIIISSKSSDSEESEKVDLVKIGLQVSIVDMLYIEAWSGELILAMSVSVLIISICLIKTCFPIFIYKAVSSKIKSVINLEYIAVCRKILER